MTPERQALRRLQREQRKLKNELLGMYELLETGNTQQWVQRAKVLGGRDVFDLHAELEQLRPVH